MAEVWGISEDEKGSRWEEKFHEPASWFISEGRRTLVFRVRGVLEKLEMLIASSGGFDRHPRESK